MILIALGSNQSGPWGSAENCLLQALSRLDRAPTHLIAVSSLMKTKAFGVTNQPDFVNAVAIIKTALSPQALMRRLHMIEREAGRRRLRRWGPRTLDLDLLDYHGRSIRQLGLVQKALTLPHPGIAKRSFVLLPIAEIAPRWKHPSNHKTAAEMIQKL
jgi:2-amino-4-hydroxy-6-hydroxymethyldihydropteridine diphosphokinase